MIDRLFRYAYAQAKTRAMKSGLLDHDDWHYLLRMQSLNDFFSYLTATDYGPFLSNAATAGADARSISLSLHDALFKDYIKLTRALPKSRSLVLYGLLSRYEAENVKTLLRGIWRASPDESIRSMLYRLGTLSRLPVAALLEARQVPVAVDLLKKTVFHAPLVHALVLFRTQDRLFPLEIAVDMAAFRLLADRISGLRGIDRKTAAGLAGVFTDGVNLSWLVRFRWIYGLSPEEIINYSLPGGHYITLHDIGNLARVSDLPAFLAALPHPYRSALEKVRQWRQVQLFFQTWLVAELYGLFRKDPFHIGLPLSYILLKEMEVKALEGLVSAIGAGESFDGVLQLWEGCWMRDAWNEKRETA
ncbi:MAG: V-type ATPase subunit [Desulfobacterales bacterium]|jgi:V/A-type H+-transporting ATPase subunit C|nr:V-type ATPase subunit [Desulfobacterales bacterium]